MVSAGTHIMQNDNAALGSLTATSETITGTAGATALTILGTPSGGLSTTLFSVGSDANACDYEQIGNLVLFTNGAVTSCGFGGSVGDVQLGSGSGNMFLNSSILIPGTPGSMQFFSTVSSMTVSDTSAVDRYVVKIGTGASNFSVLVSTQGVVQITSNTIVSGTTFYQNGQISMSGSGVPANSQALCLLSGQLGHCTTVVGVGGGCTCVAP